MSRNPQFRFPLGLALLAMYLLPMVGIILYGAIMETINQ